MAKDKPINTDTESVNIILIDDRLWKSLGRDAGSFVTLILMAGIGRLLDIEVMEWIGGLFFIMFLAARFTGQSKKFTHTIDEALARLESLKASQ